MSATRTQVYLTARQRRRIEEITQAEDVTLAEVVRRALDVYLDWHPDPQVALARRSAPIPAPAPPDRDEGDRH